VKPLATPDDCFEAEDICKADAEVRWRFVDACESACMLRLHAGHSLLSAFNSSSLRSQRLRPCCLGSTASSLLSTIRTHT